MTPLVLVNVVGLTPRLLAHMPNLKAFARRGWQADLGTVLPAVTCSVQSTFLTGRMPAEHGVVGNGWYFRELGEVHLWRQHNALVRGDKLWDGLKVANLCWWYAMGASTEFLVTPRPVYHADGRKSPDCYTRPPGLRDDLTRHLGPFPLFHYWGPTASITSTHWIRRAAQRVLRAERPDLTLVYLPHLDYDLQRYGPRSPQAVAAARRVDAEVQPLLAEAESAGATVVVLSEYGITPVHRPVDVNRVLRAEGLLEVYTQDGMEYLDPWTSRAFAVADHQVAHVYVRDETDLPRVRDVLKTTPGVDEVLGREEQARYRLDHERSGELVVTADPDSWFTYYYWLDDDRAPDFARTVDIHRKPGYDPAELFFDDPVKGRLKAARALVRKKIGLRYTLDVVPLDPSRVRGSHGRLPESPSDGPVLLCSDPAVPGWAERRDGLRATDVRPLVEHLLRRS
ncbi:alkaline phosphatase family protein [Lentzea sp. NPDC060358]|uniref:alkaline phosphatase family protein n=1 Tax=Lentzea sp. NPDC060358 TaxID=3347103 RepID=UPI0036528990